MSVMDEQPVSVGNLKAVLGGVEPPEGYVTVGLNMKNGNVAHCATRDGVAHVSDARSVKVRAGTVIVVEKTSQTAGGQFGDVTLIFANQRSGSKYCDIYAPYGDCSLS